MVIEILLEENKKLEFELRHAHSTFSNMTQTSLYASTPRRGLGFGFSLSTDTSARHPLNDSITSIPTEYGNNFQVKKFKTKDIKLSVADTYSALLSSGLPQPQPQPKTAT